MHPLSGKAVPLPTEIRLLAVTRDSRPLAGAAWLKTPLCLEDYGYVEEEYIVGGSACVYAWPESAPAPVVLREDGAYRTRILVRKPRDPARFSGTVALESFNGSFQIDHQSGGWGLNHDCILAAGDVWVGYTKDANCIHSLLRFDKARYEGVGFPNPKPESERGEAGWDPMLEYCRAHNKEFPLTLDPSYERGLTYDAAFQIAMLCKSGEPGAPLADYRTERVIGFGINDYNTFISALHPYLRMPGGAPVFDGYLMYMSGEGGALNNEQDMFPLTDERCRRGCDVPVIRIQTAGDLLGDLPHPLWAALWRAEDSDARESRMRWYEIPGLGVRAAFRQDQSAFACDEDYARLGISNRANDFHPRYWNRMCLHLMNGAYENLKAWIIRDVPPPKADRIRISGAYPDLCIETDALGNHLGGIRHTYVEVPVAVFGEDSGIRMLDRAARERLYSSQDEYVSRVREHAGQMARQGWILPSAVESLVQQAAQIEWQSAAEEVSLPLSI